MDEGDYKLGSGQREDNGHIKHDQGWVIQVNHARKNSLNQEKCPICNRSFPFDQFKAHHAKCQKGPMSSSSIMAAHEPTQEQVWKGKIRMLLGRPRSLKSLRWKVRGENRVFEKGNPIRTWLDSEVSKAKSFGDLQRRLEWIVSNDWT